MRKACVRVCLPTVLGLLFVAPAAAQSSKSEGLAKKLAAALDAKKLDSVAAKDPASPDTFIGALYFPGLQLLAISGKYASPPLLDARLEKHEYRDVYVELNGASSPGTMVFVGDLGVDGLRPRREDDRPPDNYEAAGKRTSFDGDWRRQQLSEEDYMKAFADADARYAAMLSALIAELE